MSTTTKNTPAKGIMLYGSMGTWLNEFLQNAARDLTKETARACATSSGPPVGPKLVS
jgi:hypothetical protein